MLFESTATDHKNAFEAWVNQAKNETTQLKLLLPIGTNSESILLLPIARHGYHGMIIDFDQEANRDLLNGLLEQAYSVVYCKTWTHATRNLLSYLEN